MAKRATRSTEVYLKNRRDEEIVGTMDTLREPGASVPREEKPTLAIIAHGFNSDRNFFLLRRLSEGLLRKQKTVGGHDRGLVDAVLRFDFSGCGESSGPPTLFAGYDREKQDVDDVVEYFSKRYSVVCLAGHSKGATAILHHAATHDDVPVVIALSARYDMHAVISDSQLETLRRDGSVWWRHDKTGVAIRLTEEQYDSITQVDNSIINIDNIKKAKKLLFIHGTNDVLIDSDQSLEFVRNFRSPVAEAVILEGADHFFTSSYTEMVIDHVRRAIHGIGSLHGEPEVDISLAAVSLES